MIYANCGAIAVIASTTYMTTMELFDDNPAPSSPEMMMIVIDHNTNICILNDIIEALKLAVEGNRFWSSSIITTTLLPFLAW